MKASIYFYADFIVVVFKLTCLEYRWWEEVSHAMAVVYGLPMITIPIGSTLYYPKNNTDYHHY